MSEDWSYTLHGGPLDGEKTYWRPAKIGDVRRIAFYLPRTFDVNDPNEPTNVIVKTAYYEVTEPGHMQYKS